MHARNRLIPEPRTDDERGQSTGRWRANALDFKVGKSWKDPARIPRGNFLVGLDRACEFHRRDVHQRPARLGERLIQQTLKNLLW